MTAQPGGRPSASRVAGALAALVIAGGTAVFAAAVLATQGVHYPGFVSEAGVAGQPDVTPYRWGLVLIAVGLVLLAVALATRRPRALVPAELLLVSGVLAGVSSSVACSPGCPLPPYQTPTAMDLVHGGASTIGVGLAALAILLLAVERHPSRLRTLCRWVLVPVIPLGLVVAYALAFLGRGETIGVSERALLLVILVWAVLAGLSLTWPGAGPNPGPSPDEETTSTP